MRSLMKGRQLAHLPLAAFHFPVQTGAVVSDFLGHLLACAKMALPSNPALTATVISIHTVIK